MSIFRRNKEIALEPFSLLTTTYNANNNTLEANIDGTGEFIVGYTSIYPPVGLNPSDNSKGVSISPVLSWGTIDSAATYQLQLATDINFTNIVLDSGAISSGNLRLLNLKNFTEYYWRIKVFIRNCESDWSGASGFTTIVGTPNLVSPANMSKDISTDNKLVWSAVVGGENYHIQVSETNDFKNIIFEQTVSGSFDIVPKNLQSIKIYYWRVSTSNNGVWGNWSAIWSFTTVLSPVILASPAIRQTGVPVSGRISWEPLSQATSYIIQISRDSNFTNSDTVANVNNNFYFDYFGLANSTNYYWRVRGSNSDVKGIWSQVWSFKTMIATPELQLPNNNAANVSPNVTLAWKTTIDAALYEVNLSLSADFKVLIYSGEISTNSLKLESLKFDSTYYWRVKAKDSQYFGLWSETHSFAVQSENVLAIPNQSYPENNIYKIPADVSISWAEVFNAKKYEIQLSNSADFKNNLFDIITDTVPQTKINGLNYNTAYYWHVKAMNDKVASDWSETWSFTTKLKIPEIISPVSGEINLPVNVKLIWNPTSGAGYYHIQVAEDSSFNHLINDNGNVAATIYIPDNIADGHEYFWRLNGLNKNNESGWTDVFTFSTAKATGVQESDNVKIQLYPNPASSYIVIKMASGTNFTVNLFNSLGDEVYNGNNTDKIDLRNFTSGLYYYHISGNNEIFNGNFIISK